MSISGGIGELPEQWEARPLRSVAEYAISSVDKTISEDETPVRLCNYTDVYHNDYITPGLDFMRATASKDEISKFGLSVDDVVITKDSEAWNDIGVPALVRETTDDLVCGYHLALLRPRKHLMDGSFLFRCFQAKPIQLQLELSARGITRFGLSKSDIGATRIPVPPLQQQRAIADYLDRRTARLDALVVANERVLSLLAEKRQALITRAVTRGVDSDVTYRDTGTSWLGDIPAHWSNCHLKRALASVDYGISDAVDTSGSVAVLRMGDIQHGEIDYSNIGFVEEVDESALLQPGDIVFNRTNSLDQIGKTALYRGRDDYRVSFASYLVRFRCGPKVLPEFLNYLLNSSYPMAWGRSEALPAIGQANLNPNRYGYLPIALPPLTEQRKIVAHISEFIGRIDALRAKILQTITLLKERRAALVEAAVTGGIDMERAV